MTLMLAVFSTGETQAQRKVMEDTLHVKGVCGMCKERIEEAAYGKGVKFVSWDKATDQLAVAYRSDKTSLEEVESRILKAGHSTENKEAKPEDYEKLPMCCRYMEKEKH
jgi:hypothetical protein